MVHTYASLNDQRLSRVHPYVKHLAQTFLNTVDTDILITHGFRSFSEQADLYAKGRTTAGKIVTNAQAGYSYHNYGLAIDFVPINLKKQAIWNTSDERWSKAIKAAEDAGFESGSKWQNFKDYPHLQFTFGYKAKQLYDLYVGVGRSMDKLYMVLDKTKPYPPLPLNT